MIIKNTINFTIYSPRLGLDKFVKVNKDKITNKIHEIMGKILIRIKYICLFVVYYNLRAKSSKYFVEYTGKKIIS